MIYHPAMAVVFATLETFGVGAPEVVKRQVNEDHVRYLETRREWYLNQKPDCNDDEKNDINQLLELPERTPIDMMMEKKLARNLDEARQINKIHKDYYKTHQEELFNGQ